MTTIVNYLDGIYLNDENSNLVKNKTCPGWWLQGGAERALCKNPGCNIRVVDEQGFSLCGIVSPNATKTITLIADNDKIYR